MRLASLLAVLISLTGAVTASGACARVFDGPVSVSIPSGTVLAFAVADVTGDARNDLLLAGTSLWYVPATSGPGPGFGQPVTFDVPARRATAIAAADLDGDGDQDVIAFENVLDQDSHLIRTYTNTGGMLHRALTIPAARSAGEGVGLFTGDFNGDDRNDFAFAGVHQSTIQLFTGNGDGTVSQSSMAVPRAVVGKSGDAGDVDGDGFDDLVLATEQSLLLFFGSAAGLSAPVEVMTGLVFAPQIVDVDGDGVLDIAHQIDGSRFGWLHDLRSAAPKTAAGQLTPTVPSPGPMLFGDLTNDGKTDVAVNDASGTTITVYAATGSNAWVAAPDYLVFSDSTGHPSGLSDVDRDGDLDIVDASPNTVTVLVNQAGVLQSARAFGGSAEHLNDAVADFNHDGLPDILSGISAWLGRGDGTFQHVPAGTTVALASNAHPVLVGDVNGDTHPDFVRLFNNPSLRMVVGLGRGDGSFDVTLTSHSPRNLDQNSDDLRPGVLADLNLDGKLDLLSRILFGGRRNVVWYGNGDGTFQQEQTLPAAFTKVPDGVADFNGDGRPDLFLDERVYVNQGTSYAAQPWLQRTLTVKAFADVNLDGVLDLLATNLNDTLAWVALGRGDGNFEAGVTWPLGLRSEKPFLVRDFNSDGRPDILAVGDSLTEGHQIASLLPGDGKGGFGAPVPFETGGVRDFHAADVNRDGRPDLLNGPFVRLNVCAASGVRRRSARH